MFSSDLKFLLSTTVALTFVAFLMWLVPAADPDPVPVDVRVARMEAALSAAMTYDCADPPDVTAVKVQNDRLRKMVSAQERDISRLRERRRYDIDQVHTVGRDALNADLWSKLGRAVPHRGANGRIDGYRVSGIRRGTLPELMGVKNGDVIHSVNGWPLTTVQQATSAAAALAEHDAYVFQITRRSQQRALVLVVE